MPRLTKTPSACTIASMFLKQLASYQPASLSAVRIVSAFCYSQHGYQKIFGALGGHLGKGGSAELASLLGLAGLIEVIGGGLLVLGLWTRPVAFLLSGQMAFAYFYRHAPQGFWPIRNGGELAAVYAFLFLFVATAGGGPWSLDKILRKQD